MNLSEYNLTFINDGDRISDDIINKFQLRNNIKKFVNEDKYSFVGLIFSESDLLISLPKHYSRTNCTYFDVDLLVKSIFKAKTNSKFSNYINENEDSYIFPIKSYLDICNYYNNYGLFREESIIYSKGYSGKIDWKKTLISRNYIISNFNLIFIPFDIRSNDQRNVFLTTCMSFALSEGFSKFGKIFNVGIPYVHEEFNISNFNFILEKLKGIQSNYFKDSTKKLIKDLIIFFTWLSSFENNLFLITQYFNLIWEEINNSILNTYSLSAVDGNKIIFTTKTQIQKELKFHKRRYKIESLTTKNTRGFNVEFDHYCYSGDKVYIFDSKYYQNINEASYKQFFYYYLIKNELEREGTSQQIECGLLLPTDKEDYYRIHVDRSDLDGLVVIENYINIKKSMNFWVFKTNLSE